MIRDKTAKMVDRLPSATRFRLRRFGERVDLAFIGAAFALGLGVLLAVRLY